METNPQIQRPPSTAQSWISENSNEYRNRVEYFMPSIQFLDCKTAATFTFEDDRLTTVSVRFHPIFAQARHAAMEKIAESLAHKYRYSGKDEAERQSAEGGMISFGCYTLHYKAEQVELTLDVESPEPSNIVLTVDYMGSARQKALEKDRVAALLGPNSNTTRSTFRHTELEPGPTSSPLAAERVGRPVELTSAAGASHHYEGVGTVNVGLSVSGTTNVIPGKIEVFIDNSLQLVLMGRGLGHQTIKTFPITEAVPMATAVQKAFAWGKQAKADRVEGNKRLYEDNEGLPKFIIGFSAEQRGQQWYVYLVFTESLDEGYVFALGAEEATQLCDLLRKAPVQQQETKTNDRKMSGFK